MMARMVKCLLIFTLISFSLAATKTDFKFVEYMDVDRFEDFKDSAEIRVVYFYKRDVPRLQSFYREYERSAELLTTYDVRCAVVECSKTPKAEYCSNKKVEHYVYAFRDGYELLQLELESMFDVNSIMSNILQLVLLRDVPIVQTETELFELEDSVKGQHDLIFSYHRAIGTYEHRVFMDVAYAYQSKYKFGVTTEKTTISSLSGAKDTPDAMCMIWALSCKDVERSSGDRTHCSAVKYTGKLDMVDVATFVRGLGYPGVHKMPEDGVADPYVGIYLHILYLYHDNAGQAQAYEHAQNLSTQYRGLVGIITVNVESPRVPEEFKFTGSLPTAKLKLKNISDDRFISGEFDSSSLSNFLRDAMEDFRRGVRQVPTESSSTHTDQYMDKMDEIETEVERQDDQVAKSVLYLRTKVLPLDNVPALTDKTFPQTIQQKDLIFVLFYLKVSAPSTAFLHAYADAGATFTSAADSPLARVDCFDWTDVCQKENITMYPTVQLYRKGQKPVIYNGHLGQESILSAIKLFQLGDSFVKPVSKEEVRLFSEGLFPQDLRQSSSVFVLGLLNKETDIREFQTVAAEYKHRFVFGLVTDKTLTKQVLADYGVTSPCILLFKRDDLLKPVAVFKKEMTVEKIGMFVYSASLPLFGELSPASLPQIQLQFKPLVLVFLGSNDKGVMEAVSEVAVSGKFNWAIYSWMNVSGLDNVGSKLLYHYTKQPKLPHISLIIRYKSEVYNFPGAEFSVKSISNWLKNINENKISPSMNLPRGTWQPKHEGYDFLRMIDEGVTDRLEDDDVPVLANDEGLGFDEDGHYQMEHGTPEEVDDFSESVDSFYQDKAENMENEVDTIEHSRLSNHHKRSSHGEKSRTASISQQSHTTPQGSTTQQGSTTHKMPDENTHDAGEF